MDAGVWIALIISAVAAFYTYRQAQKADQALAQGNQLAQSNAVMHFTDRFFDLMKDSNGDIAQTIIDNQKWANQFWSLHATEFYFFHHNWLPTFMYSLWMVDLAGMYAGPKGEAVRKSHQSYLDIYALNYTEMSRFFEDLCEKALKYEDKGVRNKEIATWIEDWIKINGKNQMPKPTTDRAGQIA